MKRRTFLKASATGLSLASLGSLAGCELASAAAHKAVGGANHAHLVFDGDSPEFMIDPTGHRIFLVDDAGKQQTSFGKLGKGAGELNYPVAGAIDGAGNLYVVDRGNSRIVVHDASGKHLRSFGDDKLHGKLHGPSDLALDGKGNVFVSDTGNARIQVFTTEGKFVCEFGRDLNGPRGITIDGAGNVHVVDAGNARVVVFAPTGDRVREYGGPGAGEGKFLLPRSIASNGRGQILVGDPSSGFVSTFTEEGNFVERSAPLHPDGTPACPLELSASPGGHYVWTGGHVSVRHKHR